MLKIIKKFNRKKKLLKILKYFINASEEEIAGIDNYIERKGKFINISFWDEIDDGK